MKKLRIYLETSVIGDFDAATERGAMTREFFRLMKAHADEYELIVSPMLLEEIDAAPVEKQTGLLSILRSLDYLEVPIQDEANKLAKQYIAARVLNKKHINDLTHVAYAVLNRCDYIVSWNMKHIVRAKTMSGVQAFNRSNNYHSPNFVTPTAFTGEMPSANDRNSYQ